MHSIDLTQDKGPSVWCLADPGRIYLAYLPQGGEAVFKLDMLVGECHAQWFNPRSGERLTATQKTTTQGLQFGFAAPDQQDWVLILKARNAQ